MLTLFTIPKPFQGHSGVIQTNAMESWARLFPDIEVIMFGGEAGVAEVAARLNFRTVPDVPRNERGTPLLNTLFEIAQKTAMHDIIGYVNTDIILMNDFAAAVKKMTFPQFLLLGHRWDTPIKELISFTNPDWEKDVRTTAKKTGKQHPASGIDYFIFRRGLYQDIPPFAVGRGGYDNWLVYRARAAGVPVVDATKTVLAVHQNHDYGHVAGGANEVWKGKERENNIRLMGGMDHSFSINYATHVITDKGISKAVSPRHLYYRLRAWPVLHPQFKWLLPPFKLAEKAWRAPGFFRNKVTGK